MLDELGGRKPNVLLGTLLFFFFFTLHADNLGLRLIIFNIRVNNLLCMGLLLWIFLVFRGRVQINHKLLVFSILLVLTATVSMLFTVAPERSIGYVGFCLFIMVGYLLTPYVFANHYDLKAIFRLYLWAFFAVGVYALLQFTLSLVGFKDPTAKQVLFGKFVRPQALAYEPSYYALYLSPFVALVNTFYLIKPREIRDLCGFPVNFFTVICSNFFFLLSTSTGAFLTYFIIGILWCGLALRSSVRKRFPKLMQGVAISASLFALVCFVGALIFDELFQAYFLKFFIAGTTHYSFQQRWLGIMSSFLVFLRYPLFGVGLGNLAPFSYYDQGYVRDLGVDQESWVVATRFEPTNVSMEILGSLGLVGAAVFAYLFFFMTKFFLEALRASYRKQETAALMLSMGCSVLVMLFVLQFNGGLLRTYPWVHLSLASCLFCRFLRKASPCEGSELSNRLRPRSVQPVSLRTRKQPDLACHPKD